MTRPRFSVVIPTRERTATLRFTLRTCLAQDFDDYEIVVCDNAGSPATRDVVDEMASPKIRYVRAPRPLAMSDNWELAVSQAAGEYVAVLGDDDGLLFHALRELDRLTTLVDAEAIRWSAAFYAWPTIALPGEANYLRLPMRREVRMLDARSVIASVIRFEAPYVRLPMLYNSIIHRDLIERVRGSAGRLFGNRYPDVYSGFALAYAAGRYASVEAPMSIAGTSGESYGVATLFHRGRSALDAELRGLNDASGLPMHRWVPDLPIFPEVPVADSFQLAKEVLFLQDRRLRLDRRQLAAHCMKRIPGGSDAERRAWVATVRDTLQDDPKLGRWFDKKFKDLPAPAPRLRLRADRLGFDGEFLHLSADAFGVADVYAAAELCEKLVGYRVSPIAYDLAGIRSVGAAAPERTLFAATGQGPVRLRRCVRWLSRMRSRRPA